MSFARNNDRIPDHCPCCGRFPSEDHGYYAFIAAGPDFVSLFCDEACARRYEMKGGAIVDGDGNPDPFKPLTERNE